MLPRSELKMASAVTHIHDLLDIICLLTGIFRHLRKELTLVATFHRVCFLSLIIQSTPKFSPTVDYKVEKATSLQWETNTSTLVHRNYTIQKTKQQKKSVNVLTLWLVTDCFATTASSNVYERNLRKQLLIVLTRYSSIPKAVQEETKHPNRTIATRTIKQYLTVIYYKEFTQISHYWMPRKQMIPLKNISIKKWNKEETDLNVDA